MTWTAPKLCKSDQLCEVRSQEGDVHTPLFFAKSAESTDCKGLLKSRDAKECVNC